MQDVWVMPDARRLDECGDGLERQLIRGTPRQIVQSHSWRGRRGGMRHDQRGSYERLGVPQHLGIPEHRQSGVCWVELDRFQLERPEALDDRGKGRVQLPDVGRVVRFQCRLECASLEPLPRPVRDAFAELQSPAVHRPRDRGCNVAEKGFELVRGARRRRPRSPENLPDVGHGERLP
jgi:hypothetical protein